ncbi:Putative TIM-barrel fold metal-dependent hydrolase [Pseudomonas marincola]|uniref:6-methylsalicylate decarboxylase n=1 Tax=Pseudomonas marincola TaxID=437900 RepID=A0A653E6P7_9PSED|nr:amidohydrolase family protein [Pseudomonas marincola]CAE6907533.1 Putative TIM-barrel fold metal-dependent hydrolase [Pseudomonas marincola]
MFKQNRRSFLTAAGTTVAGTALAVASIGAVAAEPGPDALSSPGKPCSCGLVDVHAHYLPPFYAQALADAGLVTLDGGFPVPQWSEQAALDLMAEHDIEAMMMSVSSPSVGFLKEPQARQKLARQLNDFAADVVSRNPKKFGAFATLPLPDLDASLAELEYALDHLKLDGVIIESNLDGMYLGDPKLEPLFAALDKRKATLFLHPTSPACFEAVGLGRPAPIIEFPMDTARTVTDLLFAGTLKRHPNVRMIVPHAGGALPALAYRLKSFAALPFLEPKPEGGGEEVRQVLASLYYDLAGSAHDGAIESLRQITSTSHIMFGSDFPFTPPKMVAANVKGARELSGLTKAEHEGIARNNAYRLFPRLRPDRATEG